MSDPGSKAIARTILLLALWEASKADLLGRMEMTEIADAFDVEGSRTGKIHKVRDALQMIAYSEHKVNALVEKLEKRA